MIRIKLRSIFVLLLLVTFAVVINLYWLSKSRTFQLFGDLVNRVNTKEKVVALTFDDAPSEYTEPVLNILEEKNIKATFFVIGRNLEKYPQIGKDIATQGHEIGNHSYSHQRLIFKSPTFINLEIQKTNSLIRQTGYHGEILFRPPNGKKLIILPWYLQQHNIKTVMWDIEPDTYVSKGSDNSMIADYTLKYTQPGSIILLHPFCENCIADREAIGKIIDGLQNKGYRFLTVSELLTFNKK
jgi:peptidoglycan-N-acetylglucosamine deacetylase